MPDTLAGFPTDGVSGARIGLRPFTERDLTPAYVSWLNDPEVVRYSDQRFRHHTIDSCREYLARMRAAGNHFVVIDEPTRGPIGTMGASVVAVHRTADLGILVGDRSCWGRGYGLEAWSTMMAWLLNAGGLRKVTGGTMACNVAMKAIMERSGMTLEGVRREQQLLDGTPVDIVLYGRLAPSGGPPASP